MFIFFNCFDYFKRKKNVVGNVVKGYYLTEEKNI